MLSVVALATVLAEPVQAQDTPVWTATMTVGETTQGLRGVWPFYNVGSVSPSKVSYLGTDYSIDRLTISDDPGETNDYVTLGFASAPPTSFPLILEIGGAVLPLDEGTRYFSDRYWEIAEQLDSLATVTYPATSFLGLSVGDTTTVCLRTADQVCSGGNKPATGTASIAGAAIVGEELTAGAGDIADPDGLTSPTYTYQWIRLDSDGVSNPTNIGTDNTYTLAAADDGKKIKVELSFADDSTNTETRLSNLFPSVGTVWPVQDSDVIWATTMTIGDASMGRGIFDSDGSIAHNTMAYDGTDYAVNVFVARSNGVHFRMQPSTGNTPLPAAGLTLEWAEEALPLSDAVLEDLTRYKWTPTWLNANAPSLNAATYATTLPLDGTINVRLRDTTVPTRVLVSNIGQGTTGFLSVVTGGGNTTIRLAQRFRVEPDNDYTLTEVTLDAANTGLADVTVTIHEPATDGVNPSTTALYTLDPPASVSGAGRKTYTAPENATLAKGASYFVHLTTSSVTSRTVDITNSNDEDTGIISGWTIDNTAKVYTSSVWGNHATASLRMQLKGHEGANTAVNRRATGTASIGGAAIVGEELTAGAGNIADDDGLTSPTYTYQWIRLDSDGVSNPTNIGTASTYTLVAADEGKKIKVELSFEDDDTNPETRPSNLFPSVGTVWPVQDSDVIWATTLTIGDASAGRGHYETDGSLADDTFDYDGSEYVVEEMYAKDGGVFIAPYFTDGNTVVPSAGLTLEWAEEALPLSDATVQDDYRYVWSAAWVTANASSLNAANYATTLPLDGTINVRIREEATTPTTGVLVSNIDKSRSGFLSVVGGTSPARLAQKFLVEADKDYTLTEVTVDAGAGGLAGVTVSIREPDIGGEDPSTTALYTLSALSSLSGDGRKRFTAPVNATLTKGSSYFVHVASSGHTSRSVAITMDDGEDDTSIAGWSIANTARVYTSGSWDDDINSSMKMQLKGHEGASAVNIPATGTASIGGAAIVGEELTAGAGNIADDDGLTSPTYTYQWIRLDSDGVSNPTNVGTASTYTLVAADDGKKIKVELSFEDDDTNPETRPSNLFPSEGTVWPVQDSDVIWATTLTIGAASAGRGHFDPDGSLADATFDYDGVEYGVFGIYAKSEGVSFNADDGGSSLVPSAGLTLEWAEEALPLSDATVVDINERYQWSPAWVNANAPSLNAATYETTLPLDGTINVRLREETVPDEVIWSTTMTIGRGTGNQLGYHFEDATGSLADSEFDHDGTNYDVDVLLFPIHTESGRFGLSLNNFSSLPASAVLEVDGESLPLASATGTGSSAYWSQAWLRTNAPSLHYQTVSSTWSVGNVADVCLRTGAAVCPISTAANGIPVPTGPAQVGATLRVNTSGIRDRDGLTNPTYTYQWKRVDTDGVSNPLNVGTDSTYTVVAADAAKKIIVEVSFTDDANNPEGPLAGITNAIVPAANACASPVPADEVWCATVTVGYGDDVDSNGEFFLGLGTDVGAAGNTFGTLSNDTISVDGTDYVVTQVAASTQGLFLIFATEPELPAGHFSLHLQAITGEFDLPLTGASLETNMNFDERIRTFNSALGGVQGSLDVLTLLRGAYNRNFRPYWAPSEEGLQFAIRLTTSRNATGEPVISGPAQVDATLTAHTDSIADADGLGTFTYQWIRVDTDGVSNPIDVGTNSNTYTVASADAAKRLKVEVSYTDGAGNDEVVARTSSTVVPAANACASPVPADEVWCSTVTVGYGEPSGGYFWLGLGTDVGSAGNTFGTLSDSTFSVDGTEYVVTQVTSSTGGTDLVFATEPELSASHFSLRMQTISAETDLPFTGASLTTNAAIDERVRNFDFALSGIDGSLELITLLRSAHSRNLLPYGVPSGEGLQFAIRLTDSRNATGAPSISGTPRVGQTLTAGAGSIADPDGLTNPTYTYQWIREDSNGANTTNISSATDSTYLLAAADEGKKIRVQLGFDDDGGTSESRTSDAYPATGTIQAASVTSDLPWSTTLTVGNTTGGNDPGDTRGYDATAGSLDDDEFIHGSKTYDVLAVKFSLIDENSVFVVDQGGGSDALPDSLDMEIAGLVLPLDALALGAVDGWHRYSQSWLATNAPFLHYTNIERGMAIGAKVALCLRAATQSCPDNTAAMGNPSISGTASVGQTLTAAKGNITDGDGTTNVTYGYQWLRVNSSNTETSVGTNSSTYTPVAADVGNTIKVRMIFLDGGGFGEMRTSGATAAVTASNIPATGQPAISGVTTVGQTLTATSGNIADGNGTTGSTYSYQWSREESDGSNTTTISGATDNTYTLVDADAGKKMKVTASFTDDANNDESRTSNAYPSSGTVTALTNIAATGQPAISGVATVGVPLRASKGTISDGNGLTNADGNVAGYAYSYQWIRVDGGNETNISGAASSVYTLVSADEGKTIKVTASFTDDADFDESRTSAATATVSPPPDVIEVVVQATAHAVPEGETAVFLVRTTEVVTSTLAVSMSWSQTGSFWAQTPPSRVTFSAGDTLVEVGVRTVDDRTRESNGRITATVQPGSGYEVGSHNSVYIDVHDNDSPSGICPRTRQVHERIVALLRHRHGYVGDCSGVTDADLAQLTSMDLDVEGITSLRSGDFAGLSAVAYLSLTENQLRTLPRGVFGGLAALEELRLSRNQLAGTLSGVFVGMPALEELSLANNNLSSFPFDDIETLSSLTKLSSRATRASPTR